MRRHPNRSRLVAAALLGALAVSGLAGCTASAMSGASSAGGSAAEPPAARGEAFGSADTATSGKAGAVKAATDRSVVTTASLDLVARDPAAAADRIEALVASVQGSVQRSTQAPNGRSEASLVVRIPADVFPATMQRIEREKQNRVRSERVEATDVTGTVTDTAVRVQNLRTSITRLQKLLADADSTADLVAIESALTDRQTSLEQLLGQQRTLSEQVASATLTISIVQPSAVPAVGPDDFVSGFAAGFDGLVRTGAGATVVLGVVAPWLIALGVLGGVTAAVLRAVRRRRTGAATAG